MDHLSFFKQFHELTTKAAIAYTDFSEVWRCVDEYKPKVWAHFKKSPQSKQDTEDYMAVMQTLDSLVEQARQLYLNSLDKMAEQEVGDQS